MKPTIRILAQETADHKNHASDKQPSWCQAEHWQSGGGFTERTKAMVPDIKTTYGIRRRNIFRVLGMPGPREHMGSFVTYRGAKREGTPAAFGRQNVQYALFHKKKGDDFRQQSAGDRKKSSKRDNRLL